MQNPETVELFRPVGEAEYRLIAESGFAAFPPRLPGQPIFYPVLTQEYAETIARDWNTKDQASGYVGYVLRFRVSRAFLARYEKQQAGTREHLEYWIPAEELPQFNRHIVGRIEIVKKFERA